MSFMSKLADKFADALGDKDKNEHKSEHREAYGEHNFPSQAHQQQYRSQEQYGHNSYSSYEGYNQPPSGPPGSQLPPGWIQQWDPNSQRYYYVEQATGRTQWEPPSFAAGYGPPPGCDHYGQYQYEHQQYGHDQSRAMYEGGQSGSYGHGGYGQHYEQKDGKGGMIAAGLGGAALGAIGGAVIAHELTEEDSDGEVHTTTVVTQPAPVPPPEDEISSSDAESIHEAQDDVEDAQEELAEASSESDREEAQEDLEEAQEEYEEEVEEAED